LVVPNVAAQNYNSATTFKPYNESDIIGNVTPESTPPKKSCNPVATIIMVAVAVAVTVVTKGAAGSTVSQLTGMAMGGC